MDKKIKINNKLPLRTGVGIVLLNNENKIFVGKRIDSEEGDYWQLPQGGVNENENFLDAAKRELEEETSVKTVRVIKELDNWLIYDLPENLLGKIWNGKFRGQKQKWFVMKFFGEKEEINIKTQKPEFLEWKWLDIPELTKVVVNFKAHIYNRIAKEINSLKLN